MQDGQEARVPRDEGATGVPCWIVDGQGNLLRPYDPAGDADLVLALLRAIDEQETGLDGATRRRVLERLGHEDALAIKTIAAHEGILL